MKRKYELKLVTFNEQVFQIKSNSNNATIKDSLFTNRYKNKLTEILIFKVYIGHYTTMYYVNNE